MWSSYYKEICHVPQSQMKPKEREREKKMVYENDTNITASAMFTASVFLQ